jgi:replication factor A1
MIGNYEKIVERIARSSGLETGEIERRVEAKRAKLSGLISKEGAAQVIAAELGISFDNEKLKINELLPGMRKVNVVAKIINIFPVRTFTRNGKESKVANMIIADETSNTRAVLWDVNHIELIERNRIGIGSVIEISNASMRDNEIHLGSFSEIKPSNEQLEGVMEEKIVSEKNIKDVQVSDNVKLRAFIVQSFEPRYFNLCPECRKKVNPEGDNFVCEQHGQVAPQKRALINLVIDDGTETIRGVAFSDNFPSLGLHDWDSGDAEKLALQRHDLLGREMIFSGSIRNNKFFNNMEFNIEKAENVDLDQLMEVLQKK